MHPFFARLTAADLDLGAEMFAHPGALAWWRLRDLLWNASQNDRMIALDPVPEQFEVRHGRNVEVEVLDLAHDSPVDLVLLIRPPAENGLMVLSEVGENAVHVDKEVNSGGLSMVSDCPYPQFALSGGTIATLGDKGVGNLAGPGLLIHGDNSRMAPQVLASLLIFGYNGSCVRLTASAISAGVATWTSIWLCRAAALSP